MILDYILKIYRISCAKVDAERIYSWFKVGLRISTDSNVFCTGIRKLNIICILEYVSSSTRLLLPSRGYP